MTAVMKHQGGIMLTPPQFGKWKYCLLVNGGYLRSISPVLSDDSTNKCLLNIRFLDK